MKGILKVTLFSFLLSAIISGVLTAIAAGIVDSRFGSREIDVNVLKIEPKPTIIYDKDGEVLAQFRKERKDVTNFEEIPEEVIHGIVSTEDREFYEHPGINVRAITRAFVRIMQANGAIVEGGSTITQQLVKTMYLTPEKALSRKIEEAVGATLLEEKLTKDEILTHYLNHIFYGNQAYGIRGAVETYFGESLEEFKKDTKINRIAKGALLAGIPNLPTEFSPYTNPDGAKVRRNVVITNMYVEGYITKEEYEAAMNLPLLVLDEPNITRKDEKIQYPELVTYVLAEGAVALGLTEDVRDVSPEQYQEVMYSGTKIYTSFDRQAYEIIRKHMSRAELYPANASDGTQVQGSFSLVDPKTGEIYAFTSGREPAGFLEFNRAYQSGRQPGSTFKPIIAYGPALESGKLQPYSVLPADSGHVFSGGYRVKTGYSSSSLTMENAVRYSNNVSAVSSLETVGVSYAKQYAEKLGFKLTKDDDNLAIALGGLTKGVSTLELANGYQAFANEGKMTKAHAIRKIVSFEGEPIYEPKKPIQVIKKENAEKMKFMLRNVVTSGTGTAANVPGHMVVGKTGTTEMPGTNGGNKDIWFAGFTKDYVGTVWMGFDQTDQSHFLWSYSSVAANMFGQVMKELLAIRPDLESDHKKPKDMEPEVKDYTLNASVVDEAVELSWTKAKNTTYKLYKNGVEILETKDSSFFDKNVTPGETYTYKVVGFDRLSNYQTYQTNVVSVVVPKPEIEEPEEKEPEKTPEKPNTTQPTQPTQPAKPKDQPSEGENKDLNENPSDNPSENPAEQPVTNPVNGAGETIGEDNPR